jgi:hypothetical protein
MAEAKNLEREENGYHEVLGQFVDFLLLPSAPSLSPQKNEELILIAMYPCKASGPEDPMALYRLFLQNLINPHSVSVREKVLTESYPEDGTKQDG